MMKQNKNLKFVLLIGAALIIAFAAWLFLVALPRVGENGGALAAEITAFVIAFSVFTASSIFALCVQPMKKRLRKLAAAEEEFTAIKETMDESFIIVDKERRIVSSNRRAEILLDLKSKEQRDGFIVVDAVDGIGNAVRIALGGEHFELPEDIDGRCFRIIANPVYSGEEIIGAVVVLLDATELSERETLRREFSSNVSHELKTPLTSISGFAEIIKNRIAKGDDVVRFGEKIYDEAQRLIMLINDIIKLSQLDEGEITQEWQEVDLYALAARVIDRLEGQAVRRGVSLKLRGDKTIVSGAPGILEEMIYNLVDNAIKYNKPAGRVTVMVNWNENGSFVSVSDTGIGISKEHIARVFERFYRVDKSHSREIGGTGLGLSIVKHGAEYHGAKISVESEVGSGTTITIRF